jgi:spore coat protein U-like protein
MIAVDAGQGEYRRSSHPLRNVENPVEIGPRDLRLIHVTRPHFRLLFASALTALLMARPAQAQSSSCSATITSIAYGTADVLLNQPIDTTLTLQITCAGAANETVRVCANLGRVAPPPGTSSRRLMSTSVNYLNHELYSNPARTQVWGSLEGTGYASGGVQIDIPLGPTGTATINRTIYGRVLAGQQTVPPEAYTQILQGAEHSFSDRKLTGGTGNCPVGPPTLYGPTPVTATVPTTCHINAATLNFGTVGLIGTNVDALSTIGVQCTNALPYTVALDGGQTGATDPTQRKMSKGSEQITYGLYRDAARSLPWGSTTGTNTVSGAGNAAVQNLTVYGRMPAQSTPSSGLYADTVVVVVSY